MTEILIPRAFASLLKPKRYKGRYGGRGSSKSHSIARCLLTLCLQGHERILCTREHQSSIADSVHKLLADLIDEHGLSGHFEVQQNKIRGPNDSEFIFKGLRFNSREIKSTEGVTKAWVEEAENTSDNSWELLIPTIRAPGSEIWASWNTKNITDPTHRRFVTEYDPEHMDVQKVSWRDNPFFPEVLRLEMERLKTNDHEAFLHVWEGEPDTRRSGAIFAALLDKARGEGRVTSVPWKPGVPVITAWDLGKGHGTCIWFAQIVGLQIRIIDYHEAQGDDADLDKLAAVIRSKPYEYGTHWLPHDARHERLGMKSSIGGQLKALGIKNRIVPSIAKDAGIMKAKSLLKEAWIDDGQACRSGMHPLMHYHYEWDEERGRFKPTPRDDWSADAADALRYLAIALEMTKTPEPAAEPEPDYEPPGDWMSA